MPYAKYTRDVLTEAVRASTTMTGVLRHLGLQVTGGAHAHLRRRIDRLGIDTSHFVGRAYARGSTARGRRTPAALLIERPADARRQAPTVLRRALTALGRPYLCAECGIGDSWMSRPLTLHVDHIDGRFADCRPENLRFLCPNCHSQTATYAGRNRSPDSHSVVRVDDRGERIAPPAANSALTDEDRVRVLREVIDKKRTVVDAARTMGCSRSHAYTLLRRWTEQGSLSGRGRAPTVDRTAVVTFALTRPADGPRKLAAALRARQPDPVQVSATTVENILREAGLQTRAARLAAAEAPLWVGTV